MPDYHQFLFVKGKTDKSSFSYLPDSSSKKKQNKNKTHKHTQKHLTILTMLKELTW